MLLIIFFLYAPIATLIVLSFNASKSRAKWGGFTFKWFISLFRDEEILLAFRNTLLIAVISSLTAAVIGTMICIAMQQMKKRRRTAVMGIAKHSHSETCR